MQMALHLDSNSTIVKAHGKYAGPLAEVEVNYRVVSYIQVILHDMHVKTLKDIDYLCSSNKKIRAWLENVKEKHTKKKKKASREDRTPDPWFTRPVLYH